MTTNINKNRNSSQPNEMRQHVTKATISFHCWGESWGTCWVGWDSLENLYSI